MTINSFSQTGVVESAFDAEFDLQDNLMAPTIESRYVRSLISLFLRTQLVLKSLQQLMDMDSKR